jgi:hypothetical protein
MNPRVTVSFAAAPWQIRKLVTNIKATVMHTTFFIDIPPYSFRFSPMNFTSTLLSQSHLLSKSSTKATTLYSGIADSLSIFIVSGQSNHIFYGSLQKCKTL